MTIKKSIHDGTQTKPRPFLPLVNIGKFKLIGKDVHTNGTHYDHRCPFMLKDRYNCARNDTDILPYGSNPTGWKLV